MTEILLIRHGETDWNVQHRFQGQIDVPLNARGHEQARRLGLRLAHEPIQVLLSSDLIRARQTAEPLAAHLVLDVEPVPGMREQGFGVLEGLALDEILARHPLEWDLWRRHDADYCLPGDGECVRAFHARVVGTLHDIATRFADRKVAVVTHGGALDMVWREAHGLPLSGPRECLIPNTGINRIEVSGGRLKVLSWADDAHVADLPSVTPVELSAIATEEVAAVERSAFSEQR